MAGGPPKKKLCVGFLVELAKCFCIGGPSAFELLPFTAIKFVLFSS
ncbi:hypothetical protein AYI68_g8388, partial [Smittium mucronatum]